MCGPEGDVRNDRTQGNGKHALEPDSALASVCTLDTPPPGGLWRHCVSALAEQGLRL